MSVLLPMKTPIASLLFTFATLACGAAPSPLQFDAQVDSAPLTLLDQARKAQSPVFEENDFADQPVLRREMEAPRRRSRMPIVQPKPSVDYKMIVKTPDDSVDYKILVKAPEIRTEK